MTGAVESPKKGSGRAISRHRLRAWLRGVRFELKNDSREFVIEFPARTHVQVEILGAKSKTIVAIPVHF
jgi:hypothetical protein